MGTSIWEGSSHVLHRLSRLSRGSALPLSSPQASSCGPQGHSAFCGCDASLLAGRSEAILCSHQGGCLMGPLVLSQCPCLSLLVSPCAPAGGELLVSGCTPALTDACVALLWFLTAARRAGSGQNGMQASCECRSASDPCSVQGKRPDLMPRWGWPLAFLLPLPLLWTESETGCSVIHLLFPLTGPRGDDFGGFGLGTAWLPRAVLFYQLLLVP